ncbi:MAG: glycosyltransferase family 9 protein [Bacteroidetes bacterium]|nr:glycosyltransferase family 9 protein [Bacteroidota bacterium]
MKKEKSSLKKEFTRQVKRSAIRLIGWLSGGVTPEPGPVLKSDKVVILAQEKLGDCILLTPLIRILKDARPEMELTLACFSKASASFFESDPRITRIVQMKGRFRRGISELNALRPDVLFNTKDHPSFNFMMAVLGIKAPVKAGIDHVYHTRYFNWMFTPEFYSQVAYKNALFAGYLGISYEPETLRPYLPPQPVSEEIGLFAEKIRPKQVLVINLSAGSPDREWPLAYWETVLTRLKTPAIVLAVGSRMRDKESLEARFSQIVPSPVTRNLTEAGLLIAASRVLITPDTSLIHVASCSSTPVIGLFQAGDLHFKRFHPFNIPYLALQSDTWRLTDLSPDRLLSATEDFLARI